jgi:hypothetical protein
VFGLAECDLSYRGRAWGDIMVLYNFFEAVRGPGGRFTFVDFNGIGTIGGTDPGVPWSQLFVAQGTGAATSWDLPTYAIKQQMTTVAASISAGQRSVVPASMKGITLGMTLTAQNADNTSGEVVTVTALTTTQFTATFANAHSSNWLVHAPIVFDNGVAQPTVYYPGTGDIVIGPGAYLVIPGNGTDGVDSLLAGTAPASGHIITISGMCRRAFRRARFGNAKNPYVYNVPNNFEGGSVTILEVRK